jgi:hypothetical protein
MDARGAADQLTLIEGPSDADWRLDDRTRAMGRQGVELARRALADAARRPAA